MNDAIIWSDKPGWRGRAAWLLVLDGRSVRAFMGEPMEGVTILDDSFTKNGKWSHTTYRLVLAPNLRTLAGRDGWDTGTFREGVASAVGAERCSTWSELAAALGVSVTATMTFLRAFRPQEAAALDTVDTQLDALDEATDESNETETIEVSFGGPTRSQRAAGFWVHPKSIPGGGELRLVDAQAGWTKGNIRVEGRAGAVLDVVHVRGYGGGYVTVTVAISG